MRAVFARVPTGFAAMGDFTAGRLYRVFAGADGEAFETHDDDGHRCTLRWKGSSYLCGGDWERVELDDAHDLADIVHDLLRLHIAHHNHPVHARARAALAEIAEPVE